MNKKKILSMIMTAILAGTVLTGCAEKAPTSTADSSEAGSEERPSNLNVPDCDKMDEALMKEFEDVNQLAALCDKYKTVEITTSYSYTDENGKICEGDTTVSQYRTGANGLECLSSSSDGVSYQSGDKLIYSKWIERDENGNATGDTYDLIYTSDAANEAYGSGVNCLYMPVYDGVEHGYKKTADGYELYDICDYGEGTWNVTTYYANEDKEILKSESMMYPDGMEPYVDNSFEMKFGVDVSIEPIAEFENGEFTLTIIEKSSGRQEQLKVPANTEVYFCLADNEIVTYDEKGTQMISPDQYDLHLVVTESTTVYIVESN